MLLFIISPDNDNDGPAVYTDKEIRDARIGEALIKEVIEQELRDMSSEDVPALTPLAVELITEQELKTEQEQKIVTQLSKMVHIIGERLRDDKDFQDAINGVTASSSSMRDRFQQVVEHVFEQGITWERIAVLFYIAGKLAVKMVKAHVQSVRDILKWTVEFFMNNLLGWIGDHGGWINSFSDLAVASMQSASSLSFYSLVLVLVLGFITGLALGTLSRHL